MCGGERWWAEGWPLRTKQNETQARSCSKAAQGSNPAGPARLDGVGRASLQPPAAAPPAPTGPPTTHRDAVGVLLPYPRSLRLPLLCGGGRPAGAMLAKAGRARPAPCTVGAALWGAPAACAPLPPCQRRDHGCQCCSGGPGRPPRARAGLEHPAGRNPKTGTATGRQQAAWPSGASPAVLTERMLLLEGLLAHHGNSWVARWGGSSAWGATGMGREQAAMHGTQEWQELDFSMREMEGGKALGGHPSIRAAPGVG